MFISRLALTMVVATLVFFVISVLYQDSSSSTSSFLRNHSNLNNSYSHSYSSISLSQSRRLHLPTVNVIGDFVPLSCNINLDAAKCERWSTRYGTASTITKHIVIPCGECIWMDHDESDTLILQHGLDIRGKLVFNGHRPLTLMTPVISVQGELQMDSTGPINGAPVVQIVLTGENDLTFEAAGENRFTCNGGSMCPIGKKVVVVAGGQVNVHGISMEAPTWVRLYDVKHLEGEEIEHPSILVVDQAVQGQWLPGAEILITSHTRDWDKGQVRTITSVTDYAPNNRLVQIELNEPIVRPITMVQSPDFAVEVALLSRNIVFVGGEDSKLTHGGHFWFLNTPNVDQTLVGADFQNFGQQGLLGRYPIHMHMAGDMSGSTIAKNTIRHSNQRCIVVHNTHNLLVQENVAYDTKGHCFMIEDGMETGNRFIRNLGAQTGRPDELIPDMGHNGRETDDDPATFWITNPTNVWIGNVAAGSQGSGFWFELLLRGTHMHLYPDLNPKTASILKFENNVAHSNSNKGMKTYPTGYIPDDVQSFEGIKSYRNKGAGIFLHISGNIHIHQGMFSDNLNMAIDIDRADNIIVTDTHIIGESSVYGNLIDTQGSAPGCFKDELYGIELHTWKDRPENAGATIANVTMSGFLDTHCPIAVPIHMDRSVRTGQFDLFSTLAGMNLEDPRSAIDFCTAEEGGIVDIYLTDLDGSFRPSGDAPVSTGASSTLVSNTEGMLSFVNRERCNTNVDKCFSYCTNTCFRSARFEIDPAGTADYALRVCAKNEPTNCIRINGKQRLFDDLAFNHTAEHRVFLAHLPKNEYNAVFEQGNGEETWPSFVNVIYEDALCPNAFNDDAIKLIQPPTLPNECNTLIRNGNFERSNEEPTYWTSRFGGIELASGVGSSGSNAIAGIATKSSTTLSQFIDTRCLKKHEGRIFEITADVKLQLPSGAQFVCDSVKTSCPEVGFVTDDSGYKQLASTLDPELNERGFQTLRTMVMIDDRLALAGEVRFDIRSNVDGKTMVLDNVSMDLITDEEAYCKNVLLTSNNDRERLWKVKGGGELSTVQGPLDISIDSSVLTREAMLFNKRRNYADGIEYNGWRLTEISCLKPNTQWRLSAQLQLVHRGKGKGVGCTVSKECPEIRVIVKDASGNTVISEKYETHLPNAHAFNWFKSDIITLPPQTTWDGQVGNVVVDISSFAQEYNLVVGAFALSLVE